ncbi:MAG: Nif3-like dinuclear metal center hexameric protein [Clostridiales bacterium]|nr:Nif3-like dinuclear metal center hexameric protein [Clostridiales bacterium]
MKKPVTIGEIIELVDKLAPRERAEEWDHVGLMIGNRNKFLKGIVLSLDVTSQAIDACLSDGSNLLITHHPLFFDPCFSIDETTPEGKRIYRLIQNNIAVFSAHTNLDRADYGVNQALSDFLGFRTVGSISEWGFELLCELNEPGTLFEFSEKIRKKLRACASVLNTDQDRSVHALCLCAGAFDEDIIPEILKQGVDTIVTGEMKHHVMVILKEAGINVIVAGHESTERVILPYLKNSIEQAFPKITVAIEQGNIF